MAGLDDLLKGFQVFKEGVQELQTSRAIQGASEQVEQIRQQESDQFEQMKQVRQVAGNLTLQLTQLGRPASQIEQVVGAYTGPKPETVQTYEQGLSQALNRGDKEGFTQFKSLIDEERAAKLKQANASATLKFDNKQNSQKITHIGKVQTQYNSLTKDILKARQQAGKAVEMIRSGNKIAPEAVKVLLARASGDVGNLTETEKNVFGGSQALWDKIKQAVATGTTSQLIEGNKEELAKLAEMYVANADAALQERAEGLHGQMAYHPLFQGDDPELLWNQITGGKVKRPGQPVQQSAPQQQGAAPIAPQPTYQQFLKK